MRSGIRNATVTLDHVQTIHKGGKVYRYYRAPGKARVRLPDLDPAHPDFLAAYVAAAGAPAALRSTAGTISALVESYLASRTHRQHSAVYRLMMLRESDAIRSRAGAARALHLRADHIRADIAALDPHAAGKRLKAWRLICKHAVEAGLLPANPAQMVDRPKPPKSDGHLPWSDQDIASFRAHWPVGSMQLAAMELLHWTGARISDAVRLGPGMIDKGGVLVFRQNKTAEQAFVPWTCRLPDYASGMEGDRGKMHEALAALPSRHLTWLVTEFGTARSHKAFGQYLAGAARAAGVARSAHGLRKARAIALAEAGATTHQIAAWTGHLTLKEVEHYTRKADRRRAVIGVEQEQNAVNSRAGSVNFQK